MNPFATATELLAELRAGRITSSELTETYSGRIEKHDKRLNAVVVIWPYSTAFTSTDSAAYCGR